MSVRIIGTLAAVTLHVASSRLSPHSNPLPEGEGTGEGLEPVERAQKPKRPERARYKALLKLCFFLVLALIVSWAGQAQAQKKVRFAYPSSADMGDIPSLLAWEQLKKQGIEVIPTFFPKTDLAVHAVVAGEADIGSAAGIAVIKAVESGMSLRVVAEQVRNEWQLVTPVSLKEPKQLDGKRVGYHAPITVTEALVKWMANHYKITPNWMIIPGSDVRAEALMRGQLDATPAEIGDVLNILSAKPGQFHVLISYAKTFPQLIGSMYFARADYVQKNTAVVESVLEAILKAHRSAEESPALIKENALRLLPETKPALIDATAATYKELRIWDVNGGADKERGEASIKFFEEAGLLKKGAVSFQQAFDTGPLDRVLKKIGRK
jgi:NitT/TauT family transport system substrate-binding protein